eukprot:CCRYP_019926-RA/>CCRYP_019926-RA protein AED:0.13 eAED:0.12 QI:0/-1/0/1/-1/1/1/0/117
MMVFIKQVIFVIAAIMVSAESRSSSFSSEAVFVRGMMAADTQYMYMAASRSPESIARGGCVGSNQNRCRGGSIDDAPTHVAEKARDAAVTFAIRVQRHAFSQIPRHLLRFEQSNKSR